MLPHLDAAYSLARWLTRNDTDASDTVQEAVLRALRYFDGYRDCDAKSWLLKIVRHTCYSWLRRNRPGHVSSLEVEVEFGGEAATVSVDAEACLQSRSDLRRINQLIAALPLPFREILILRELHEMGYQEIAKVTGVPIGTVMSRLYRARSLLLRAFNSAEPGSPIRTPSLMTRSPCGPANGSDSKSRGNVATTMLRG